MFTMLEPGPHAKAKARTAAAYSGRDMPDLEVGVNAQLQTLIGLMRSKYASNTVKPHQPLLDLGQVSCFFTMDVITRLAFGEEFGYLKEETDQYGFLGEVRELWPRMSTSADTPWIRKFLFSPPFLKVLGPKPTDKTGFGALMA